MKNDESLAITDQQNLGAPTSSSVFGAPVAGSARTFFLILDGNATAAGINRLLDDKDVKDTVKK